MEEKWKLSRKESSSSSSKSFFSRTSSSKLPLLRSLSHKHTPSAAAAAAASSSAKSPFDLRRSSSQKNPSIGHKCSSLAKEQKARFYIMRRCVAMLVCWHKHGDP
ncbi:uncharacterized protein LOC111451193 [Cucurbita moschata]|uniref:Uncharacterized protein LOC111451193 n=1 Tax=Cucurbita moschata TaxID=3662 RepID=A0A6J1G6C4_CUCMO|nr:uncharacterized protein LOC111451193 [Cucurbita moschata]XP_022947284.1 uncharacterized protein LOC111451193 [Cucurbita moschata]